MLLIPPMRFPFWITKLKTEERLRAKAIYAFLFARQPSVHSPEVQKELDRLIAAANWPEDGSLPPVSPSTAKKLGIDTQEWDEWRKFPELRKTLRKFRELSNFS